MTCKNQQAKSTLVNNLGWKLDIDNKRSSKLKKLAFLKRKLH